jgi:hypothetical protein
VYAQVPDAMAYLLAEFHKVCMYTGPKHLHALNVSLNVIELFSIALLFEVVKKPHVLVLPFLELCAQKTQYFNPLNYICVLQLVNAPDFMVKKILYYSDIGYLLRHKHETQITSGLLPTRR